MRDWSSRLDGSQISSPICAVVFPILFLGYDIHIIFTSHLGVQKGVGVGICRGSETYGYH